MSEIDLRDFFDETPEPTGEVPAPVADDAPLGTMLERVSKRAIAKLEEILTLPLPPVYAEGFGNVSRVQTAAANSVIAAQVKVDETALKARQTDVLPRLLAIIEREARKLDAHNAKQIGEQAR